MSVSAFYNSLLFVIAIGFLVGLTVAGVTLIIVSRRVSRSERVTANTAVIPAIQAERRAAVSEKKQRVEARASRRSR